MYSADIDIFVNRMQNNLSEVVREVSFKMHDRTVLFTPIDTGRAKTSWNIVNSETPDLSVTPNLGSRYEKYEPVAVGASPLKNAQATLVAKSFQANIPSPLIDPIITYSNNLHYIEDLENGRSLQSPAGMMKRSFIEWPLIFNNVVSRLKT